LWGGPTLRATAMSHPRAIQEPGGGYKVRHLTFVRKANLDCHRAEPAQGQQEATRSSTSPI
jgi:transposase